ncbi:hypothetical protein GIB67_034544 [Kingdonia uniflora]|uniref:Glutaredoxin domain-containing protein n=1 Tax=Kingdonia uniflora TaxID=39325 RepID=A0A7J7PBM5_9MAGN|nr:hypothetical protein GIB67_034544 [Kingdonia uniflora]
MDRVTKLASQKAVVIFSKSTCSMSHAIKRLFYELGVSPAIHELDEDPRGREMERALLGLGFSPSVPAVFIGGRVLSRRGAKLKFVQMDRVAKLASQKAVVIFSKSTCCMSHAIKRLFYELGVSPAIHELDEDPRGREMERALQGLGFSPSVPAVFIGGRFIDSTNTIMSLHLKGSLVPMLKEAGAMWL